MSDSTTEQRSWRAVCHSWLTDGICILGLTTFTLVALAWAFRGLLFLPCLLLIGLAGGGALAVGHCWGRNKLRWMDTASVQLVDRQVLRHFMFGFWAVTAAAMLLEVLLVLLAALLLSPLLPQGGLADVAQAATATEGKEVSFGLIAGVFFMAFVVAAGSEELGKAWAVRYAHLHKCCACCCSARQQGLAGGSSLVPPPPPRSTASASTSASPAAAAPGGDSGLAAQPQAQNLPTRTLVLQPRPYVPRVTLSLFVAVAAGFSTSENILYVLGPYMAPTATGASVVHSGALVQSLQHIHRFTGLEPLQMPSPLPRRRLGGDESPAAGQTSTQTVPPPPEPTAGSLALFALARVTLSLPLHLLCALLTAFAFVELDADGVQGGAPSARAWLGGLTQGVLLHGTFDFVLMLLGVLLPGRVSDGWAEGLPIVAAAGMMLGGIGWTYKRWKRDIQPMLGAFEAPLGVSAVLQGGYAQLSTAVAPNSGEDDTEHTSEGIELTGV